MQLNLPILEPLKDCQNILIAGAGGGFDVFAGLPLYFTLRELGKTVHLANYSFAHWDLVGMVSDTVTLLEERVVGARGKVTMDLEYFPEGFLAQWFKETRGEDITVWMLPNMGVIPLREAYTKLVDHLQPDALILVDGGVDSLMRGDEEGAGTLIEDSITLAAVSTLNIPVKILACIGFGTEVEENVCHYNALQNIAALAKAGGFWGSCALTPQMEAFQLFEAACRYVWEQPTHKKSHITTRVIPAAQGEFGNYQMYPGEGFLGGAVRVAISPLMSLYWFFNAQTVIDHSLILGVIENSHSKRDAFLLYAMFAQLITKRPCKPLPY